MLKAKGIKSQVEIDIVAVINIISPWRLIDGGIAMLAPIARNHKKVNWGAKDIVPFVRKILRV